jgi:hypothetical protein
MNDSQEQVLSRFNAACQADPRVLAAFLGGSHASGRADEHSDLDLYLILSDSDYDAFFRDRMTILACLGDAVMAEDFDGFGFDTIVFLMQDGVEGELALGKESHFTHIHGGPYQVLLDRRGLLEGVVFPLQRPGRSELVEVARRNITWFWRELSLFSVAWARGRLWTAYGYLEAARRRHLDLLCIQADWDSWPAGYQKVEDVVPAPTVTALEAAEMLAAARRLIPLYRDVAHDLCEQLALAYPAALDEAVTDKIGRTGH